MASLNLSTNGPSISKSYQSVVNASPPTGTAASPTYGHWAVFSVSTPLVNAFQQDAGNKESVLKVQSTGDGELEDLIEEFSEGRVQFAYVKVTDPNTGLPKNVLIAWCGEGVPERTKGYFTSHLAIVSKFLHGYHVQITARADGDLSPAGIVQRVADSSGAKYSAESQTPVASSTSTSTGPRPPVANKPVFTPSRSGGIAPTPIARTTPSASSAKVDDDGWGPDAPPVTRTQLEKVKPAYQPTRVNLQQLKSENQTPARPVPPPATQDQGDVVRGGYQPIGKVDIAAIRKQAAESGQLKDDRPAPVKGSYEPVGKIDIAAIRARAQKPDETTDAGAVPSPVPRNEPTTLPERPVSNQTAGRLTDLPKPKVANKFGSGPSFPGTKPPLPVGLGASTASVPAPIGSASRTFADQGGKTPAQLWAERKAKERGGAISAVDPTPQPIQSQSSGQGEWKSSYTGKSWATVQTVQDAPGASRAADVKASEPSEPQAAETEPPSHVHDVRSQFAAAETAPPVPQVSRPVPLPGLTTQPNEPESEPGPEPEPVPETQQALPTPPPQPRSPTPPTPPVRESSPIRVAMPVGRNVTDAHEEQHSPPPVMPIQSLQEAVPDEKDLEDDTHHDIGRAAAEATVEPTVGEQSAAGIRAIVQFDYEKAEDNEIDLLEGEVVTEIEMVDKDWWLGVNVRGERGLFPGNYVEIAEDGDHDDTAAAAHHVPEPVAEPEPEPVAAPVQNEPAASNGGSHHPTATALYDYEAAEDNELSFPEGAKIVNVEFPDDDWWLGEYHGARGLFPANYVELDK
ncbi:actin binding protein [Penicillium brasilianum]|uniref:Actin binding protein n=1 Tax=Penicillium brasilianum TaxID=104259 RepID=A0A1S9RAV6_PENBI|nr:actin binding protein [Penicillium brasilianum]